MKRAFIPRAVLILLVLGLAFPFPAGAKKNKSGKKVQWAEADTAVETARSTGKVILYKFSAEWCGPCRVMKQLIFENEGLVDFINDNFIPVEVVDRVREDGKNPEEIEALQRKYKVGSFPTLVLVSLDPKKTATHAGWYGGKKDLYQMALFLKETGRLKIPTPTPGTAE